MKTKLLSILLALVMLLGVLPMDVTAVADASDFTYSADGATITATSKTDSSVTYTVTIADPENKYYNDGASSHHFTLVGVEEFNTNTGHAISVDDLVYYKGDNQNQDIKKNTPKLATYKARLTVEGVRVEHSFTFTAKPTPHTHSFTYTANGNVITATCNGTNGTCDLPNKQATLTLNAPAHVTFGDGLSAEATISNNIPGVANPTIHYKKGDAPLSAAPTDAGVYSAWCTLNTATATVTYTIGKATADYTTRPTAKTDLTYTGEMQELVNAGTTTGGTILYAVTLDPDREPDGEQYWMQGDSLYFPIVPQMSDAATYYVWYKLEGGKNYEGQPAKAEEKITVTIAKADPTGYLKSTNADIAESLLWNVYFHIEGFDTLVNPKITVGCAADSKIDGQSYSLTYDAERDAYMITVPIRHRLIGQNVSFTLSDDNGSYQLGLGANGERNDAVTYSFDQYLDIVKTMTGFENIVNALRTYSEKLLEKWPVEG